MGLFSILFPGPKRCGICNNLIHKTSYTWTTDTGKLRVCPACNKAIEKKKSKEAQKKRGL